MTYKIAHPTKLDPESISAALIDEVKELTTLLLMIHFPLPRGS